MEEFLKSVNIWRSYRQAKADRMSEHGLLIIKKSMIGVPTAKQWSVVTVRGRVDLSNRTGGKAPNQLSHKSDNN